MCDLSTACEQSETTLNSRYLARQKTSTPVKHTHSCSSNAIREQCSDYAEWIFVAFVSMSCNFEQIAHGSPSHPQSVSQAIAVLKALNNTRWDKGIKCIEEQGIFEKASHCRDTLRRIEWRISRPTTSCVLPCWRVTWSVCPITADDSCIVLLIW